MKTAHSGWVWRFSRQDNHRRCRSGECCALNPKNKTILPYLVSERLRPPPARRAEWFGPAVGRLLQPLLLSARLKMKLASRRQLRERRGPERHVELASAPPAV